MHLHSTLINSRSRQTSTDKRLQVLETHVKACRSYKINLGGGTKNPIKWILLAYFDSKKDLILDPQIIARIAFSIHRTPRTVRKQLSQLKDCCYYALRKNDQGQFVVRFSNKKPMLKYIPLPYREMVQKYDLTPIQANLLAIYKQRELLGLRIPTQRKLANRIGCDKQSVVNGLKVLRHHELLKIKYILADYIHPRAKKWRNVYALTRKAYNTIRTLVVSSMKKLQRILSKSTSFTQKTSKESPLLVWFNKFKQKYPNSDDRSLATTLNGALKQIKTLPAETDIAPAWELFGKSTLLKLAAHIGWREAMKACLVQKEGVLNDKSRYWKKFSSKPANFYWFITHIPEILAGKYADKALSDKAKRVWEDMQASTTDPVLTMRPETPEDVMKQQIEAVSICEEELELRGALLAKYGAYTYENWFQGCGWSCESGNLTHANAFYRNEIERKYGVRIDSY